MQIPSVLYGTAKEVRRASVNIGRSLHKGASWDEVFGYSFVDTAANDGLFLMDGPELFAPKLPHYHVYALLHEILAIISNQEQIDAVFKNCLLTAWGTLSLTSGRLLATQRLFHEYPARHIPLVRAVIRYFETFTGEGRRFLSGYQGEVSFWEMSTNLKVVLAHMGVPTDALLTKLPPGGIEELLTMFKIEIG